MSGTTRGPAGSPRPAVDIAYEQLRQAILTGELMPNERLVEVVLADRLQVSRAVVRTVLVRLGQDGLVIQTPNRGAHVRLVTEAEAIEILQARAVLEGLAARQAALEATAQEIASIRRVLGQMTRKLEAEDLLGYSDHNAELHAAIIAAARHETAARLIAGLRAQLVRYQFRTILVPGRAARSLAEHTAIVEAIADGDPDAAETAMRRHLGSVETNLANTATMAGARRTENV
ncbi:GntR family transcriptional regulator [Solwaraspora sp. WMMD1047]|uniref:GntR family transcriptional regulator n=1 Tax=Solwaraspora sp. WMMD1047 TaxID=3016102 RepID=UPI0024168273|nr:GntR family transcriptional regulator [Solwaraspora sp. WMMD1047]MDG4828476.1 GntR family transcriptional regulator [Solwaraspora sp. WMMD1047]